MMGFPYFSAAFAAESKNAGCNKFCVFLILLQIPPNLPPRTWLFCLRFLHIFLLISARQMKDIPLFFQLLVRCTLRGNVAPIEL